MNMQLMGASIFPVLLMRFVFAVGFIASLLFRQTKHLALMLCVVFVAMISGVNHLLIPAEFDVRHKMLSFWRINYHA